MSTLMKWLVMLVLWLLFALLAFKTCVHECCTGCCEAEQTTIATPPAAPEEVQRYPIDFQWDDATAFTNEGFEALRTRLVNEMGDNDKLIITGRYFASEKSPDPNFATMGLARAAKVRDLLAAYIDPARMELADLRLDDREGVQKGYFESVDLEWQAADAKEASEVVELDNKVVIRFPYNSAVKDADPEVDEYLNKLALRLSQTTERVNITGHTDNRGDDADNMKLSERRAKFIRDILVRKGVATDRLVLDWKGESDPTSTNETEEGRHNNRRVELQILSGN
ncbi:MAG: OmpA family protein [Saprospiraceae bacterium]